MRIVVGLWFDVGPLTKSGTLIPVMYGMSLNPEIDFIIFSNDITIFKKNIAPNIFLVQYDRTDLIYKINKFFDIDVPIDIDSIKFGMNILGAMKPYGRVLFDEEIGDCYLYGWIEYDIILEIGFDRLIIEHFLNDNIFSYGIAGDSSNLQIIRYESELITVLIKNKILIKNWFNHNGKGYLRYFDEASLKSTNGIMGFIQMRNSCKGNRTTTHKLTNSLVIGNGWIKPEFPFTIKYDHGKFDRTSIAMDVDSLDSFVYKNKLINSNIIWSLDKHYKTGNSYLEDGQLLDFGRAEGYNYF